MKVLVVIPHHFDPAGGGRHGSLRPDADARIGALVACLTGLHAHLGREQVAFDFANRTAPPANAAGAADLEVVVVTTREGRHLLGALPLPAGLFRHETADCEPMMLPFACRDLARAALGRHDWYCYLEDDLVLEDPWFLAKLAWWGGLAGPDHVLLPNRFETGLGGAAHKGYVDGTLAPSVTAPWRDLAALPRLQATVFGRTVLFDPARNPHAGSWFLTAAQMERWAAEPWFADRDTSFVGPLESGATLGILRAFKPYKPATPNASFLEIRHFGTDFLSLLRRG